MVVLLCAMVGVLDVLQKLSIPERSDQQPFCLCSRVLAHECYMRQSRGKIQPEDDVLFAEE